MLDHFEDYTDVVGDHPLNLLSTTLALNAYMLEHEPKYKRWLLEYVDAWVERMKANGGIIPSVVRQADCTLCRAARPRLTFSRMSEGTGSLGVDPPPSMRNLRESAA